MGIVTFLLLGGCEPHVRSHMGNDFVSFKMLQKFNLSLSLMGKTKINALALYASTFFVLVKCGNLFSKEV